MTIHDWGLFADNVMRSIEHADTPVTNKEPRLRDAVLHVAGNWAAQPKTHGIEGELPLKKLHQCSDVEQIVHTIHKAFPEITEQTLEGTLRKVQDLAHGKKPALQVGHPPVVHEVLHDRDVVVGFLQSAIDHVGKLKDISNESKNNTITILRDACNTVRSASSPVTILTSTENTLKTRLAKEETKYRSFLNWFHQTAAGVQHKLV